MTTLERDREGRGARKRILEVFKAEPISEKSDVPLASTSSVLGNPSPRTKPDRGVSGLCVGYECGQWRHSAFADYVMEWLPEFCLNSKERDELSHESAVKSLRKAAGLVYQTDNLRQAWRVW